MKPSAEARTISLFTGKTDLGVRDRGGARDGSVGEEPRRPPRRAPFKWNAVGLNRWYVERKSQGRMVGVCSVEKRSDGYHATFGPKKLGVFATCAEAGAACEAARDR